MRPLSGSPFDPMPSVIVIAFNEKTVRSQVSSLCFLDRVFTSPSDHCRHASIRTLERVDNLGAYTAYRPETGLLIPSSFVRHVAGRQMICAFLVATGNCGSSESKASQCLPNRTGGCLEDLENCSEPIGCARRSRSIHVPRPVTNQTGLRLLANRTNYSRVNNIVGTAVAPPLTP